MQSPTKFFDLSRLTLVQKLALLGVVAMGGLLFIAAGYATLRFAGDQFEATVRKTTHFGDLLAELETDSLQLRLYEKDFYLTKDKRYLDQYAAVQKNLFKTLDEARKSAPENLRPTLDETLKNWNVYADLFKQTTELMVQMGLDENLGLHGTLRDAVHEVEALVTEQKALPLKVSMLQMRRREKDYMQRGDLVYLEKMAAERKTFAAALGEARLPPEVQNTITALMAQYQKDFEAFVVGDQALKAAAQSAQAAFDKVKPLLARLAQAKTAIVEDAENSLVEFRTVGDLGFAATILLVMLALGAFLAFIIGSIVMPVKHLMTVVDKIAQGDTQARANMQSFDEISALGRQFDMMVDQREAVSAKIQHENEVLNNSIIELLQAVARLAQRDLTAKAPVAEDVTGPLGDALNLLAEETVKVLHRVVEVAGDVSEVSQQVKMQSDAVITIAAQERYEVEQATVELNDAAKTMLDVVRLALTCNTAAQKAIENTDKAQETVLGTVQGITAIRDTIRETEKRIKRLGERSQEIGSVVAIINGIAERTHILALNASMHAASAGEAGKGFAVVAGEVQKLAENARQATAQISALVNNIQVETADTVITMNNAISQVVNGTALAEQAGEEMRETRDTTAELVQLVQRIAANSTAQSKTSRRLLERAQQIQQGSEQTHGQLQAQAKLTAKLETLSHDLVQSVGVFTLPDNRPNKPKDDSFQFDETLITHLVSEY